MFVFGHSRTPRRPSLTPMIDVVFLLLVFFMLAARFGADTGLAIKAPQSGAAYEGPPRLVDIGPNDVRLNGVPVAATLIPQELQRLVSSPDDPVVLRPDEATTTQRLVTVIERLKEAGFTSLAIIE